MAEIDPVILQLRAEVNQYLSTLRTTTTKVDSLLGAQEKRVRQLETQFRSSSGQISSSLKGLAGSFAAYFSAREISAMVDGFTRFQNSLRVAGLEGQNLAKVQQDLYSIGERYGVSVESLSNLYGQAAQSGKELGASQSQLVSLTTASAQALKITGTSAVQAQGALLGLSQALASGTVRAEEFNQINEGGLRPLLQAAANAERWGGSVAKLRQDMLDGKVASKEFFDAILQNSSFLETQAARAAGTLSGAMQTLSDAFMRYLGETGQMNGATASLAGAIQSLADNLDTIIPALAIVAVAIGGRMASAALVGGTGLRALSAYASIATTSLAGTALAARGAGAALLGAFGGPVGLAITTLTLGLGYLATSSSRADAAAQNLRDSVASQSQAFGTTEAQIRRTNAETDNLTAAERSALVATANLTGEAHKLADAWARVAAEAKQAAIANAQAALDTARTNKLSAQQAYQRENTGSLSELLINGGRAPVDNSAFSGASRFTRGSQKPKPLPAAGTPLVSNSGRLLTQAQANEEAALSNLAQIKARGLATFNPVGSGAASKPSTKKSSGSAGRSGPSAADTQKRYEEEMRRLEQEELRAQAELTDSASDRADLEKDALFKDRESRIAAVENDANFTRAQKDAQIASINRLYGKPGSVDANGTVSEGSPGLLAQRVNRDTERKIADLKLNELEAQSATLDAQVEIETNTAKRNELERKALDLRQRIERARLEEAIAAERVSASTRKELEAQQAIERAKLDRAQRSPGQVYRDDLRESADNINDGIERIQVQGLEKLNDGLVDAIMGTKSLGDVFKNVANQIIADLLRIAVQKAIIEPLANSLFSSGGGGGGIGSIVSSIGSLFGRASGGYVAPGQTVRVNEAASPGRVEGFMSRDGGQIIPLGRMNALQPGPNGGGTATVRVELSGDIDGRIQSISGDVAVQVVKASAPALIDASARETMARAGRPRM